MTVQKPLLKKREKPCGRIHTEVAEKWGTGHYRYRCEKPLGHKSKEHMDGKFRWTEGRKF